MPDFNKGDFTQQGINGVVSALVRLNEKRVVKLELTSNDEESSVTITGTVYDILNNESYPLAGNAEEHFKLIKTVDLGEISTTDTTAQTIATTALSFDEFKDYDLLIYITQSDDMSMTPHLISTLTSQYIVGSTTDYAAHSKTAINLRGWIQYVASGNIVASDMTASAYGVYVGSSNLTDGTLTLTWQSRYNATYGAINSKYVGNIYGVKLLDLLNIPQAGA